MERTHYHPVDLVIVQGDTRVCQRCDKTWNFYDEVVPECVAAPEETAIELGPTVTYASVDDANNMSNASPPKFTPEEQRERTKKLLKWVIENYDRTTAKKFFPGARHCVADFTLEDDIVCQAAITATYRVAIDPATGEVATLESLDAVKRSGAATPEQAVRVAKNILKTLHTPGPGPTYVSGPPNLPDNNPKTHMGALKIPLHLVPPSVMHALALTFEDGANKYGAFNWRSEQVSASVYYGALMRHMFAWFDGEDFAEDSGRQHLHHAMACLAILIDADSIMMLNDDRPEKGASSVLQKIYLEKKK